MRCPACRSQLTDPAPECPNCEFSLAQADAKFGLVPRYSAFLTDRHGDLSLAEMTKLRAELERFNRSFPQSLFSVFISDLPPETSITEYGFWLINRARFSSMEAIREANFDLLLVVDRASNNATLAAGYGLENFLGETDLADALTSFAEGVAGASLAEGIRACLERVATQLRRAASTNPARQPITAAASWE